MGSKSKAVLLMLLAVLGIAAGGGTAHADGAPSGADVQVAQTLGARELTVIIRRVDTTPSPLRVDVVTHQGTAPGTLHLAVAADGVTTARTDVVLGATPGVYAGNLQVDKPGPWELSLDDGTGKRATIPFLVPARVVPPWEKATYGGFVAAGVFLLLAMVVGIRARRTAYALVPAAGVVAAIAVAVTGALLSASTPPPPAPGSQLDPTFDNVTDPYANAQLSTVDYSRPPVNLAVQARTDDLVLRLTDGATGRPADDLLGHDNALVHLVLVSPSGRLSHLHPVRVGPGDYRVTVPDPEAGTYAVAAELARRGGGVQLVRSTVDMHGTAAPAPEPPGAGPRTIDGTPVELTIGQGTPTTVTARFPAQDLQPWLGMLGHLIIAGPIAGPVGESAAKAPTWAHVHAMIPPVAGQAGRPDETVAAYGPDVSFTYTFAAPGRYRIWLQAERGYRVLTVPAVVDVPASGAGR
ncbi:hypothetical protein SAMN04489727_0038 [Amycolatopsis tolypomycina]|uniref:Secreted protein n=1 Tax=Amycolatopsis tolypomycina TaxID=208445 RepID=A0A1H4I457_9PSEU|nr:hypothetical protein [Amycolatopsis tolypomycina]SEB28879.1 hypothetical protein SAMN04489727_0038 [Amycolatopsis tolypomycina]